MTSEFSASSLYHDVLIHLIEDRLADRDIQPALGALKDLMAVGAISETGNGYMKIETTDGWLTIGQLAAELRPDQVAEFVSEMIEKQVDLLSSSCAAAVKSVKKIPGAGGVIDATQLIKIIVTSCDYEWGTQELLDELVAAGMEKRITRRPGKL